MDERTEEATRNQGAKREDSAAAAAGMTPADRPADQQAANAVPLSAGAVSNGGAFNGGTSPDDAEDASGEPKNPLDSETNFGGDGALYVDPALKQD